MSSHRKKSISSILRAVQYLPDRTPKMAINGGAEDAFSLLSEYRDGAIYVGHYSGNSEWERHASGDEIVMALAGKTTIILRVHGCDERIDLVANDVVVVPRDTWNRFENSSDLKVLTVTPQPTDHRLEDPDV
jgi:mannose-6-phosphate isomerase-like protein (cupin superfamily)